MIKTTAKTLRNVSAFDERLAYMTDDQIDDMIDTLEQGKIFNTVDRGDHMYDNRDIYPDLAGDDYADAIMADLGY